jgi:hypothetical protein
MDAKLERYIREVRYFDNEDAVRDILRLLDAQISLDELRLKIAAGKVSDEKEFGDDIYKRTN